MPSMRLFPLTLGKEDSKRSKKQFPQVQHGEPMSSLGLLTGAWIFVYLQENGRLKGTCITNTQRLCPRVLCIVHLWGASLLKSLLSHSNDLLLT